MPGDNFTTLIPVEELARRLGQADLFVFDCRSALLDPQAGMRAFTSRHIPGALFADLEQVLSGPIIPGSTGRHPLPDRSLLLNQLNAWGITNSAQLVAYDASNGAFAARFWWLLRWLGHADVAVLDGGFQAWTDAGLATEAGQMIEPAGPATGTFTARPALTREAAAAALLAGTETLLDARDLARYEGREEPIDPVAGHIPGAVSAPFTDNLNADGTFKPKAALRQRFEQLGINAASPAVCYCGSGVTAANNILAMVHAGLPEPALYAGSWSEWITDPDRPIATHADAS